MGGDHFLNLQPGTVVNGRYEVVKCLGAGSMGLVYACRHRELAGRLVAMKVLYSEVAADDTARRRFENEIFASYEVNHPNVVRAYEYFHDGDLIAFTMEYIGGGDLAERLSRDDLLPIQDIIRMLKQMCSGVQAIHQAGIIHRDLKPENILLTANGDIKITDFGIARTGIVRNLTQDGGLVGTVDYVSPEYLERGQVDSRSDIYALGVLAYEMITLESPFRGESVIQTMTMRLRCDPSPPTELRSECPKGLSNVVMKALCRDPESRYQSAQEILADLENIDINSVADSGDGGLQADDDGPLLDIGSSSHQPTTVMRRERLPRVQSPEERKTTLWEDVGDTFRDNVGDFDDLSQDEDLFSEPTPTLDVLLSAQTVKGPLPNKQGALPSFVKTLPPPHDGANMLSKYSPVEHITLGNARGSLESVGSVRAPVVRGGPANVEVSSGHISAYRLQQLSEEGRGRPSGFMSLLRFVVVLFVGFVVGFIFLRFLNPGLFGLGVETHTLSSEVGSADDVRLIDLSSQRKAASTR